MNAEIYKDAKGRAISNDKSKSYLLLNLHNNWHLRAGPSLEVKIELFVLSCVKKMLNSPCK